MILCGIEMKINKKDPLFEHITKKNLIGEKVYKNNKTSIEEMRKNWLAFLRMMYRKSFFEDRDDYNCNIRDVLSREDISEKGNISSLIRRDYDISITLLSNEIVKRLFYNYNKIKKFSNNTNDDLNQISLPNADGK